MDFPWDDRWQLKKDEAIPAADSWLRKHRNLLSGGIALDLACGRGRNSLFLADMGYQVLALDSSRVALKLLSSAATEKRLAIKVLPHNLESGVPAKPEAFDLILCFYYLQRSLFPAIKTRIAPGGLFIGRSFCQHDSGNEASEIIYEPGELAELFADWEILAYEEGVEVAQRGGTLAGIVARKPAKGANPNS